MAKKQTKRATPARPQLGDNVEILDAGVVIQSPITETLEKNYMPYAMSVIVSRALPEIDGFKPAHRKLLYTMYGMGLLKGARTKSANIVGSTMHLNPHGDAAIYETMVRMGRGNESLLVPFVDSKGNFGKAYSRDMAYAASRYTEAKLEAVCEELFRDIDKDTVDFVPNYDGTTTEPTLLPVTFPTILANNTLGIAVGMASNICSFNLAELCETTVALMRHPDHDLLTTLPAPDFVGGGEILYNEAELRKIYETGRGSVRVRAQYRYEKDGNMLEITRIPPTTTVEAVMDKIAELVKTGKIKEISDMRDETDLNGLKLTIDLKRGQDPDKLMQKLFRTTPLEDSFACNFNLLIGGQPRVLGVRQILNEWVAFRVECVRRRTYHDLQGKQKRLHLLKGLEAILLDIDKAIRIVRETEEDAEVVPNLMIGFGIDETQAEYVAEIKLRHLNREYILKRTQEIADLEAEIARLEDILKSEAKIRRIIIDELNAVAKKYGQPRRCTILYDVETADSTAEEESLPDYPVTVFFTREGYFKKITPNPQRRLAAVLYRPAAGVQVPRGGFCRHQGQRDGRVRGGQPGHGRGRAAGLHGGHPGLQGLHAVRLCQRQVRQDPHEQLRHQAEPEKAAQGLQRQGAAGLYGAAARGDRAGGSHQRRPDAAGPHHPDRRKADPRHRGRGGDHPEEKPAHRMGQARR